MKKVLIVLSIFVFALVSLYFVVKHDIRDSLNSEFSFSGVKIEQLLMELNSDLSYRYNSSSGHHIIYFYSNPILIDAYLQIREERRLWFTFKVVEGASFLFASDLDFEDVQEKLSESFTPLSIGNDRVIYKGDRLNIELIHYDFVSSESSVANQIRLNATRL